MDTVGAVCMDRHGPLCAGFSSGGVIYKTPGRIGQVSKSLLHTKLGCLFFFSNCRLSHDVTKIETTKLLILLLCCYAVMLVKSVTYFGDFSYLNSSCIRKNIILMFFSSSRHRFTLL